MHCVIGSGAAVAHTDDGVSTCVAGRGEGIARLVCHRGDPLPAHQVATPIPSAAAREAWNHGGGIEIASNERGTLNLSGASG